jgi:hypothetical protein
VCVRDPDNKYLSKEGERKGWSDDGIIRFNELFKLVKKDRKDNSNFDVGSAKSKTGSEECGSL